jgi:hypothetical protein
LGSEVLGRVEMLRREEVETEVEAVAVVGEKEKVEHVALEDIGGRHLNRGIGCGDHAAAKQDRVLRKNDLALRRGRA